MGLFAAIVCVLQVLGVRSYTRGALWTATVHRPPTRLHGTGVPIEIAGANKKLYQDQQQAWTRRANVEKELLGAVQELHETKVVAAAARGTGFSASNTQGAVAAQWAASLKADGVIRVNACLTKDTAAALRAHVLCELAASKADILAARVGAREVMGQELERPYRDDYLLSLLAPPRSTTTDDVNNTDDVSPAAGHPMAAALNELFGDAGKLRSLYELIVTKQGLLYEMAVMVTTPGADRQMVHADMPYQREPPLYSIFVALQDVECDMGPTVFLKGTNNAEGHAQWNNKGTVDAYYAGATPFVALLKAGDLIVYDPRVLHCGAENMPATGATRAMFNVGFRNPAFGNKDFGYKGYTDKVTFGDLTASLAGYGVQGKKGKGASKGKDHGPPMDPFERLGNGLRVV